jgi:hypothetical protein
MVEGSIVGSSSVNASARLEVDGPAPADIWGIGRVDFFFLGFG